MEIIPYEEAEQVAFVDWLEYKNIKFTAIPNSTWTPSQRQISKNKRMGLRAGLPDLLVIIDKSQSKLKEALLLFIEMKRTKHFQIKDNQKDWINSINQVPYVEAKICFGADEAIAFVSKFLL